MQIIVIKIQPKSLMQKIFQLSLLVLCLNFYTLQTALANFSLSSSSPADEATNVGQNPTFILNFPNNACHYMSYLYIKLAANDSLVQTIQWSDLNGQHTPTISFTTQTLAANTAYYIDGFTGAPFYDCVNPANLSSAFRIDFNTGSSCYNPPSCIGPCFGNFTSVKHLSPPDNGHFMQAYEGLNIIFNGNVTLGSGNITIRKYSDDTVFEAIDVTSNKVSGWGTSSLTIDPAGNLTNDTQYYVNFDIEGYSGLANKNKWNFWTKSTPNSLSGSGL